MQKKCRVFLGGYVNIINAQNINCRSIAKYLNSKEFDVAMMQAQNGELDVIKNIKIFECKWPHRLNKFLTYTKAIFWADVVYLPKGEIFWWTNILLKILKKSSFCTSEAVESSSNLEKSIKYFGSYENFKKHYNSFNKLCAISSFIAKENYRLHQFKFEKSILPLGVETNLFTKRKKEKLNSAIIIANNLFYKGWDIYLKLAKKFPSISFHVVGSGNKIHNLKEDCKDLNNVIFHGTLNHIELDLLFEKIDLHILPSRSEGFPKVILECASAGVPSLVFSDYGANNWLKAGFVVNTIKEMENKISYLINNPEKLSVESQKSITFSQEYDWKKIIKKWELIIKSLLK